MLSRKTALFVLVFAVVAFVSALTAGGVAYAQSPPGGGGEQVVPGACFWKYFGPGTGWLKTSDGCSGQCSPPAQAGTYIGQQEVTLCDSN